MNYKISLAGDLGSGKSTVSKLLVKKYGFEIVSIGQIQRQMASDMGMDTGEFNRYMETHKEYDEILDNKLKEYEVKKGNFLFDSRMAWHFVPSSYSVYLKINPYTAGERIFNDNRQTEKYLSVEDAVLKIQKRRESEILRYSTMYNVNIMDMSNYDLVVTVDGKTPEEVCAEISIGLENYYKNEQK